MLYYNNLIKVLGGLQDIGNFYLFKKTQMSNFLFKKMGVFMLGRHPDVCYSRYELFYEELAENPEKKGNDKLDWEQKLIYEEAKRDAPRDGRPGTIKTIEEFKLWWETYRVKRLMWKQKVDGPIH